MKIRTNFVTNSSSTEWGEVVIDNPVLLEILSRYKALGTFGENTWFKIGAFLTEDDIDYVPELDPDIKTKTPAFHSYRAEDLLYCPSSLEEVVEKIIGVMETDTGNYEGEYDYQLYKQLIEELTQREDEINHACKQVIWYSRQEVWTGRFGCREYRYDQEDGEYYHEEETGNLDW